MSACPNDDVLQIGDTNEAHNTTQHNSQAVFTTVVARQVALDHGVPLSLG